MCEEASRVKGWDQTRGRARVLRRSRVEELVHAARHLPPADRLLLERVYVDGEAFLTLAQEYGTSPRALRDRVRSLVSHVSSSDYRYLARHIERLPRDLRPFAVRLVLERRTLRDTARLTRSTLHAVRQRRLHVQAWLNAQRQVSDLLLGTRRAPSPSSGSSTDGEQ